MTIRHLLRDFSEGGSGSPGIDGDPGGTSEAELRTFEAGYKAGWDDAVAAGESDGTRIGSELARNLQDLSFTYQEAHGAMLRALEPLLRHMASSVLPEFARKSLAPMIAETLGRIASEAGEAPVVLLCHPDDRPRIADLPDRDFGFPLSCRESVDLVSGQVMIRFGDRETEINLPEVLQDVTAAIEGFYTELERETPDD